jgi:hypothetical protein
LASKILDKEVKTSRIYPLLKKEFAMSFKNVKNLKADFNLPINKIRRHHFSSELLNLMMNGYRIINYDESSYDKWSYCYRSWCLKGKSNRQLQRRITPPVTLVGVVDSNGNIYTTLFQSKSNERTTILGIVELVKMLDIEDQNWRQNSVLIIDNVKYHKSKKLKESLRKMKIPVLYPSPYSPMVLSVEMLFGLIKTGDHNPSHLSTTKS